MEINRMWIINEDLIDQASALDRLCSCTLDINTLSQQNQYFQLWETNRKRNFVFTASIWLFNFVRLGKLKQFMWLSGQKPASSWTQQIEPDRKSDTQMVSSIRPIFRIKHPVRNRDKVGNNNSQHYTKRPKGNHLKFGADKTVETSQSKPKC